MIHDKRGYHFLSFTCFVIILCSFAPCGIAAENLFRNSAFTVCTNAGLPDFWHPHAAPIFRDDYPGFWQLDKKIAPFPGVNSIRVLNPVGSTMGAKPQVRIPRTAMVRHTDLNLLPATDYVISIYCKADREDMKAHLHFFTSGGGVRKLVEIRVTPEWRRFHLNFTMPKKGSTYSMFKIWTMDKGTLWVAAPQLEIGKEPTPFMSTGRPRKVEQIRGRESRRPPSISAVVCPAAPVIDGKLDEGCWKNKRQHSLIKDFIRADNGKPSPLKTHMMVCRDDEALYVAFRCFDPDVSLVKDSADPKRRDQYAVFADDSVEVFLSSHDDGSDYRHLVVSASGAVFDGLVKEPGWHWAGWKHAVGKEKNAWTAEMKVPFSMFNFPEEGSKAWRVNFCRNMPRQDHVPVSWAPVPKNFHLPEFFGLLHGMMDESLRRYGLRAELGGTFDFTGKVLRIQPTVTVTALPYSIGGESHLECIAYMKKGTVRHPGIRLKKLSPGERLVLPVGEPITYKDEHFLSFRLLRKGKVLQEGGTFIYKRVSSQTRKARFRFTRTLYNPRLSSPAVKIWLDQALTEGDRLRLWIKQEDMVLAEKEFTAPLPGYYEWHPVLKKEEPGLFNAFGEVRSAEGKVIASFADRAWVAEVKANQTYIDRDRRMVVVNGRPKILFSICVDDNMLLYQKAMAGRHRVFSDCAAHGFSTVGYFHGQKKGKQVLKIAMDTAQHFGIRMVIGYIDIERSRADYERFKADYLDIVRTYKEHPALLGWRMYDEPQAKVIAEPDLTDLYRAMKQEDPHHFVLVSHCGSWKPGYARYGGLNVTEFYHLTKYPFRSSGVDLKAVQLVADIAKDIAVDSYRDGKVSSQAMQLYGSDYCARTPTIEEMYAQVYGALIEGQRAFSFFLYKPPNLELWEEMREIADELEVLSDVVAGNEITEGVRSNLPFVAHRLYVNGDRKVLVAVNLSLETVRAKFSFSDKAPMGVAVMFENRTISPSRNGFKDTFQPLARHVYELE